MSILAAALSNPRLVFRQKNIFLLSHMRANTSLFGHLLGSHPWIEGYYEMHIGYYGWKSLWRQKIMYFDSHPAKPGARFMFDKILHDGHNMSLKLLQRAQTRTIMMLRAPEQSIKSLIALYRKELPELPEATAAGAAQYYISRLNSLTRTASKLNRRYFYLDADCLIQSTKPSLSMLSNWLELDSPIDSEYQIFSNTGRGTAGDHSERLQSGRVSRQNSDYSSIQIPFEVLAKADEAYIFCRQQLINGSERHVSI
jgi:hypothetical protein